MGDLASDHESAISLIIDEYRRLKKHNENHELIKYLSKVEDGGFNYSNNEKILNEFLDKYSPRSENTPTAVMFTRYYTDLRNAVDKIEGIDRSPKPTQQSLTIENKFEKLNELPF